MRPGATPLSARPGTVAHAKQGRCAACASHVSGERKPRNSRPEKCSECQRVMVPSYQKDRPEGSVSHAKGDLCVACNSRKRRGHKRRQPVPTHCVNCSVPVVPWNVTDIPEGKKKHKGRGLCSTCYHKVPAS